MRDGWRVLTLGAVCTISKGTSPTQKTQPGPYPLIVTGPQPLSSDTFQFEGEAVCVPLVSSTGHGHASLKRVHYARGKFAVANIIAACSPREANELDARYLFLYLQQYKDAEIVTRMKGTANVSLSLTNLASVPVILPPLDEQRRIVDLIAAIDTAAKAAEEEAAASIHVWRDISRSSGASQPKVAIGDLVTVAKSGGTPSRTVASNFNGSIPWLKSGEVRGREIRSTEECISESALASSATWLVPAGAVLIAMYGATAGQVGQAAAPLATNQAVLALLADTSVVSQDLLFHIIAAAADDLKAKAIGAAQPNISKKIVVAHEVAVAPFQDQSALVGMLNSLFDAADAARATAESLRKMRSDLLTVLLSGEYEIPSSYDGLLKGDAA